jgi:hypothetical protein
MASKNRINVQFGGTETDNVSAGTDVTSDTLTMNSASGAALRARVKVEAHNQSTPSSGDEMEVYVKHGGDPDSDSATEFDSTNEAEFVAVLNTNADNPATESVVIDGPFADDAQLLLRSQASSNTIDVTAEIVELYA